VGCGCSCVNGCVVQRSFLHAVVLSPKESAIVQPQVMPMLRQLARPPGAESGGWQGGVAVLAEKPKAEMDQILNEELFSKGYR